MPSEDDDPQSPAANQITSLQIFDHQVELTAIRAQGPGGQNVNKVATAIHLRFNIAASTLPGEIKERLLALSDQRITRDGIIVIKAQHGRSQEKSRAEAMARLRAMIDSVTELPKLRRPTRPSRSARRERLESKVSRGKTKAMRGKVRE